MIFILNTVVVDFMIALTVVVLVLCMKNAVMLDLGLPFPTFEYYGNSKLPTNTENINDDTDLIPQTTYLKTGTTIVGICCRDGIVLGADTRSTGGPLVMDKNKRKIHPIAPSILCCAAGTSADCDQITRKASQYLGLIRIEKELAGEFTINNRIIDSITTAVTYISRILQDGQVTQSGRKTQSVLILGGMDDSGPALFQIDSDGVPIRMSFGALGSGSTDALAVLESERFNRIKLKNSILDRSSTINNEYIEDISTEEAILIVRKAVQSGILNDLGSGSHVDLCVITKNHTRIWRENMQSSWDNDRIDITRYNKDRELLLNRNENIEQNNQINNTIIDVSNIETKLGRRIFSRYRLLRRLIKGKVEEVMRRSALDSALELNIELIE